MISCDTSTHLSGYSNNRMEMYKSRKKQKTGCVPAQRDTFLHNCIRSKMRDIESNFQVLIECYPDSVHSYDDNGFLPLHLACIYYPQNVKIIENLVKAYKDGIYFASKCIKKGNVRKEKTASLQKENRFKQLYPIHIALKNNATLDVLRILSNNDNTLLQKQDKNGKTALSIAIQYQVKTDIINWILATDCTISKIPDLRLNLPIHVACKYGCDEDIVETLLLSNESDINLKNRDGENPLDIAFKSSKCSDEVTEALKNIERKVCNVLDV